MENLLTDTDTTQVSNETESQQAPAQASASYKDFISDDGSIDSNFSSKYKEWDADVDDAALKNFLESNGNDLNRVVKAGLNLNKMLGKEKVPLPGDNATAEEWSEFWVSRMGAPGKDGEYKVDDKLKEALGEETLNGVLEFGKQTDIPQRLMDKILPFLGEAMKNSAEQGQVSAEDAKREALENLESSFGRHGTPEFAENIQMAQAGLKILAADLGVDDLDGITQKYGNDPFLLRVFAEKAKASGESPSPAGQHSLSTVVSADEDVERAKEAYFKSHNERDRQKWEAAIQRRDRLK